MINLLMMLVASTPSTQPQVQEKNSEVEPEEVLMCVEPKAEDVLNQEKSYEATKLKG